jgi:cytidylate kinase
MSETIFFERCQSYIDCHLKVPKATRPKGAGVDQPPTVTISRQSGAGGITVAHQLANWLQGHAPKTPCPWTVFHKNLVERVLEDHNLPQRLSQFMPEDKVSGIGDAMEELLGLHPSSWNLLRQTTETILQLAELGNVILVGRGANVITAHLKHAFHVRLVGSVEQRVLRIQEYHQFGRKAALAYIRNTDAARRRYLRKYFQ